MMQKKLREPRFLLCQSNIDSNDILCYTEWDPIYMVHKDPECQVYLTAMAITQVYKAGHLAEQDFDTLITYTASLPSKFQMFLNIIHTSTSCRELSYNKAICDNLVNKTKLILY